MRRWRVATGLATLLTAGCSGGQTSHDPRASVVAIEATGCRRFAAHAVGTVVGDGLVATVAHAVAGEAEIVVRTADGRTRPAEVAAIDTGLDVAILRIDESGVEAIRSAAYSGGDVELLGVDDAGDVVRRPAGLRRRVTIRTTDIYRRGEHLRQGFEVAARIRAGDSGGALVDGDGRLVGMVWAASRQADDRAWAVTAESFEALIDAAATSRPVDDAPCSR